MHEECSKPQVNHMSCTDFQPSITLALDQLSACDSSNCCIGLKCVKHIC